ncbi:Lsr2 family DNA-binding protein [Streptomyces marianii]|uniref:Lsr2 DNA-binding domain-containing protein n=1 Tax=Streptomyces marianii TaxID=1817406 RepID=A0A5R9E6X3_9ACTN|nr:histone-like nucleoid-structuring protein Lsr2 [Streptomyces marianii]TLQ45781.1 hypothetical protein FEF34_24785 [Streptomyces marianii]
MTIAALRALLDAEQPHVLRHHAPWIPHTAAKRQEKTMAPSYSVATAQAPQNLEPEALGLGPLLTWAAAHPDKAVQDLAEQARDSITALRRRHKADTELAALDSEEAKLEQRLAELRGRKAELLPKRKGKAASRDYDPKEVRAWARANGYDVPDRGQIPKAVLADWRDRDDHRAG